MVLVKAEDRKKGTEAESRNQERVAL